LKRITCFEATHGFLYRLSESKGHQPESTLWERAHKLEKVEVFSRQNGKKSIAADQFYPDTRAYEACSGYTHSLY
jgi:hypothetical protein